MNIYTHTHKNPLIINTQEAEKPIHFNNKMETERKGKKPVLEGSWQEQGQRQLD